MEKSTRLINALSKRKQGLGCHMCARIPFSHRVELQALDGHCGPPVGVLRLEDRAEAALAQVVQVGQLLVGDDRQSAGQAADIHVARGALHGCHLREVTLRTRFVNLGDQNRLLNFNQREPALPS